MDQGRRKRIADIAEKLGVGLLLGTVAQGIFVKEMSLFLCGWNRCDYNWHHLNHRIRFSVSGGLIHGTDTYGCNRCPGGRIWFVMVFFTGVKIERALRILESSIGGQAVANAARSDRMTAARALLTPAVS